MKNIMKNVLQIICFLIATVSFCISSALGQDDTPGQPPDIGLRCLTKEKGYTVHFTAYQQQDLAEIEEDPGAKFQPYCREIPKTGLTYITLDLVDRYTRNQPVGVRIVEAEAKKKPGTIEEVRTLVEVPEKEYRSGTLELKVDFDTPALYAAVLTIGGEEINIPVRVGIGKEVPLIQRIFPIILGILVLAALGYWFYRFRFLQGAKPKQGEEKKEEKDMEENKDKEE